MLCVAQISCTSSTRLEWNIEQRGPSNSNNHVYMAVALEAWQEVGQEGSKQASERRKQLGDWRTHYTKDISTTIYKKNTNLKNMLKGLSVGKTFTTTVRQVTPFYDWQTSFPHSAVRANAAAPEPKAVTEGKEGGGGGEGMEVCLSFKRVCAIKFTFAFACAARLLWPFSHGARKYATIFLIKRSTGCQNAVECNFRQTVSTCVCVWMCICVSECVSLGVLAKLPWLFLLPLDTRSALTRAHTFAC